MRSTRARALVSVVFVVAVLSACAQPSATAPGAPGAPNGDSPVSASSHPADPAAATNRGTVTGRVVGADGSPVAGVVVQPKSLESPARPIPELVVTTDKQGTFQWTLEPGRYEFQVQPVGASTTVRAAPQATTVTVGQTVTLDLRLG
ncbi:carboxypeptidase family protein [Micromonospora pisi]|uniref:Carboxypeptidase family protein n=1 Tax=Micromonospora pisi TaxID=589240 RepID=A0A495JRA2_9ACTN|nr:carboxypeptidase-like regulatory domain-containing protein [Micromonospora pisi]RKR91165.1 carboxypeptidase family protein [Micromonospora pisi]